MGLAKCARCQNEHTWQNIKFGHAKMCKTIGKERAIQFGYICQDCAKTLAHAILGTGEYGERSQKRFAIFQLPHTRASTNDWRPKIFAS